MISQSPTYPVLKGLLWPIYRHGVINPQLLKVAKSPDVGHNIRSRACVFGMVTMASTKRSLMQLETKDIPGACLVYNDIAKYTKTQLQKWLQCRAL